MAACSMMESLLEAFQLADKDGNQCVSRDELVYMIKKIGLPDKNVDYFMSKLDLNEDGKIELTEFKRAVGLTQEPEAEWRKLFLMIDLDRSGDLSIEEVRQVMDKVGIETTPAQLEEYFVTNDCDGNGKLSAEEFKQFLMNKCWR
ncbi:hypothetical protein PHET_04332 [Paragonimus heterotremus]|uniref:EF-hand domain-containing protein n=1 Tax=Paragonimus heterotremus TaxID=100268 RepID=A0A8J4TGA4_9TREM|nr:hypothetical protein PHET_04332 [Paragonimus heterotremus]